MNHWLFLRLSIDVENFKAIRLLSLLRQKRPALSSCKKSHIEAIRSAFWLVFCLISNRSLVLSPLRSMHLHSAYEAMGCR